MPNAKRADGTWDVLVDAPVLTRGIAVHIGHGYRPGAFLPLCKANEAGGREVEWRIDRQGFAGERRARISGLRRDAPNGSQRLLT